MNTRNAEVTTERASVGDLEVIHGLVGETLLAQLIRARRTGLPVSSRVLSVAVSYLKLCGIAGPMSSAATVAALLGEMPDFDA